jgi:hypothetical protein
MANPLYLKVGFSECAAKSNDEATLLIEWILVATTSLTMPKESISKVDVYRSLTTTDSPILT